jgi:hypothetical protein
MKNKAAKLMCTVMGSLEAGDPLRPEARAPSSPPEAWYLRPCFVTTFTTPVGHNQGKVDRDIKLMTCVQQEPRLRIRGAFPPVSFCTLLKWRSSEPVQFSLLGSYRTSTTTR